MKETYDCLTEAQTLWRELDNQPMLADSLNNLAESLHMFAEFDRSIQAAEEGLEIGRKIGNLWGQSYSLMILGPVYHEKGLVGKSMRALHESIKLAEQARFQAPPFMSRLGLSWIHAHMGDQEGTARLIEEALVYARSAGTLFYSLESHRVIFQALLLLAQGKPEEAIERLGDLDENYLPSISEIYYGPPIIIFLGEIYLANQRYEWLFSHTDLILQRSMQNGVRLFAPDMHLYKGKALAGLGRAEEALRELEAGQQEARSQGSLRSLWQILAYQARLYEGQGDTERTAGLRQEARQIVSFIADQIIQTDGNDPILVEEGERLRGSFLELPEVRELYAGAR